MTVPIALGEGSVLAGDFRVVRPLAEGGMGAVYVVEQLSTGKRRALKVMLPDLVANPLLRARFEREAKIGSRIASQHVVEVIGAGVDVATGLPWLAMELLSGEHLAAFAARMAPLSRAVIQRIVGELCHALAAAHRVSVVHRDLKPENIFVAQEQRMGAVETVKVLDFGIAAVLNEAKTTSARTRGSLGTPLWWAPEQAQVGPPVTPATDVWALGLIVYWLLTGRYFWRSAYQEGATLQQMAMEQFVLPLATASQRAAEDGVESRLPAGFDGWFSRAVHRQPARRFADAGEAFLALSRILVPEEGTVGQRPSAVPAGGWGAAQGSAKANRAWAWMLVGATVLVGGALGVGGPRWALRRAQQACRTPGPDQAMACEAACARGGLTECVQAGERYENANGVPKNLERAAHDYQRGCEGGDATGCVHLGAMCEAGRGVAKDEKRAADLYQRACESGDMLGCQNLGAMFRFGKGVVKDENRAVDLYQKACDGGNLRGCDSLGWMSENGAGVALDPRRAVELYQKACEGREMNGCNDLGRMHGAGKGVDKDEKRAAELYKRACEGGALPGCVNLGMTRERVIHADTGNQEAADLYEIACEGGEWKGCIQLGLMLERANGVPADVKRAAELFQKACDGGDPLGCNDLGWMYEYGLGVATDKKLAADLYQRACEAEVTLGCNNLQRGVDPSRHVRRFHWFYLNDPNSRRDWYAANGGEWVVDYSNGEREVFQEAGSYRIHDLHGALAPVLESTGLLLKRRDNPENEVFVVDFGSPRMWVLYRSSEKSEWSLLGKMRDPE